MAKYTNKTDIRKFNRMVKKINDELMMLERTDPDSVSLERWRGYFHPIDESMKLNLSTFRSLFKEAKRVYESGQLSAEGQERSMASTLETLRNELGLDYINRKNFNSFMRFLDDARSRGLGSVYSSEQLLDAIHEAKKKGLTKAQIQANIDRWAKKSVQLDSEGKQIEIINPPQITVRKIKIRRGNKRK